MASPEFPRKPRQDTDGVSSPYPITQGKDGRYYYYSPTHKQWNPIVGTTRHNPDGSTTTDRRLYGTPTKYVPRPNQTPEQFFSGQEGKPSRGRSAPGDSRVRGGRTGQGDGGEPLSLPPSGKEQCQQSLSKCISRGGSPRNCCRTHARCCDDPEFQN